VGAQGTAAGEQRGPDDGVQRLAQPPDVAADVGEEDAALVGGQEAGGEGRGVGAGSQLATLGHAVQARLEQRPPALEPGGQRGAGPRVVVAELLRERADGAADPAPGGRVHRDGLVTPGAQVGSGRQRRQPRLQRLEDPVDL
jgi:hypothetical protein